MQKVTPTDSNGDLHERPIGELMRDLSEQIVRLVRQEAELAKTEMTEKAKGAGVGAGLFGGAGIFGLGAFATLTATIIWALVAAGLATWLSALIVTVIYALIAGIFAVTGKKKFQAVSPPVPEKTIDSVKETVQWAKTQARSNER